MNSTTTTVLKASRDFGNFLMIPNPFPGYAYNSTSEEVAKDGRPALCFHGDLLFTDADRYCPQCGCRMKSNQIYKLRLRHIPMEGKLSFLFLDRHQFLCPNCGATKTQEIPFKAEHHLITKALEKFICQLLEHGMTNRMVAWISGVTEQMVKNIDKERLLKEHTENGKLRKPLLPAKTLAIDEFSLHRNHRYATIIIDLDRGYVLWVAEGKKKNVVYDFIDHVGLDWMKNVEAVACDMNSDFQEAFQECCPHLNIVYDRFHLIKNFNDMVVEEIRRDEQRRLEETGDKEAAKNLKGYRYILLSNRETLEKKDELAAEGKQNCKESTLFPVRSAVRKGGNQARYEALLNENKLFFSMDLVKTMLQRLFSRSSVDEMETDIEEIVEICNSTKNVHFEKFAALIARHVEGIVAHAKFQITSGRIEGINNKIKTIRRQAYGYLDDEYFFLKIIDMSYRHLGRERRNHKVFQ